jgi:hypothetical protein
MNVFSASRNSEIVLNVQHPNTATNKFESEILLAIFDNALSHFGMNFAQNGKNRYSLRFKDLNVFKLFHEQALPQCPFAKENDSKPYIVRVSYEKYPSKYTLQQLYDISSKPYNNMKVPIKEISNKGTYELTFPNEEAYFISMVEVLKECEKLNPNPVETQIINQ